jgi:hypothetical protein
MTIKEWITRTKYIYESLSGDRSRGCVQYKEVYRKTSRGSVQYKDVYRETSRGSVKYKEVYRETSWGSVKYKEVYRETSRGSVKYKEVYRETSWGSVHGLLTPFGLHSYLNTFKATGICINECYAHKLITILLLNYQFTVLTTLIGWNIRLVFKDPSVTKCHLLAQWKKMIQGGGGGFYRRKG